jgi:hypothetical protein
MNMTFKIAGIVLNFESVPPGQPLPLHACQLLASYHTFDGGVSTEHSQTKLFPTDAGGKYSYDLTINNFDLSVGLSVTVGNDGTNAPGWSTRIAGQYGGTPEPPSPVKVHVSDTTLQQP